MVYFFLLVFLPQRWCEAIHRLYFGQKGVRDGQLGSRYRKEPLGGHFAYGEYWWDGNVWSVWAGEAKVDMQSKTRPWKDYLVRWLYHTRVSNDCFGLLPPQKQHILRLFSEGKREEGDLLQHNIKACKGEEDVQARPHIEGIRERREHGAAVWEGAAPKVQTAQPWDKGELLHQAKRIKHQEHQPYGFPPDNLFGLLPRSPCFGIPPMI